MDFLLLFPYKKLYAIFSLTLKIIAKSLHTNVIQKFNAFIWKCPKKWKYTLQTRQFLQQWFVLNGVEIHLTVVIRCVISFDREARHLQFNQTTKQTYWSQFLLVLKKTFFFIGYWSRYNNQIGLKINIKNSF